jgi:hypothetical protein
MRLHLFGVHAEQPFPLRIAQLGSEELLQLFRSPFGPHGLPNPPPQEKPAGAAVALTDFVPSCLSLGTQLLDQALARAIVAIIVLQLPSQHHHRTQRFAVIVQARQCVAIATPFTLVVPFAIFIDLVNLFAQFFCVVGRQMPGCPLIVSPHGLFDRPKPLFGRQAAKVLLLRRRTAR